MVFKSVFGGVFNRNGREIQRFRNAHPLKTKVIFRVVFKVIFRCFLGVFRVIFDGFWVFLRKELSLAEI